MQLHLSRQTRRSSTPRTQSVPWSWSPSRKAMHLQVIPIPSAGGEVLEARKPLPMLV